MSEKLMMIKEMAMTLLWVMLASMDAGGSLVSFPDSPAGDSESSLVNMGSGCVLRIANLYGGSANGGIIQFSIEEGPIGDGVFGTKKPLIKTLVEDFLVPFSCRQVSKKSIKMSRETYLGIFDEKKMEWAPYYLDEVDKEEREHVTRFYPIKSINAEGFAVSVDDIIGDEWQRRRMLQYCLFHGEKLICGATQVMFLTDPKGDLTPYALEVLRSIEFVDSRPASTTDAAINSLQDETH